MGKSNFWQTRQQKLQNEAEFKRLKDTKKSQITIIKDICTIIIIALIVSGCVEFGNQNILNSFGLYAGYSLEGSLLVINIAIVIVCCLGLMISAVLKAREKIEASNENKSSAIVSCVIKCVTVFFFALCCYYFGVNLAAESIVGYTDKVALNRLLLQIVFIVFLVLMIVEFVEFPRRFKKTNKQ
ncbi:MAG: hypothetical protein U0K14_02755 [Eggerthellaceae bacterium]|nr:hypothetical protein [Eggerthellaceae bacterium]